MVVTNMHCSSLEDDSSVKLVVVIGFYGVAVVGKGSGSQRMVLEHINTIEAQKQAFNQQDLVINTAIRQIVHFSGSIQRD